MAIWSPWKSYLLLFLVVAATFIPLGYLIWTLSNGKGRIEEPQPQPSYPSEYSPGIVITEVSPAPIYYETYIPLILEHELPNFDELVKHESDPRKSSLCKNARKFSGVSFDFCKEDAVEHLWKTTLKNMLSELASSNWMNSDVTAIGVGEQEFNYEKSNEFCSKIEGHFNDNVMESKSLQSYLKYVESCRSDRFLSGILFKNSFNITDISKVFKSKSNFPNDSDLSIFATTLINLSKQLKKWKVRFENCKSDRILYNPFVYSSENVVQKIALQNLEDRLVQNDIHELSIPSTDFEKYKSLRTSLTDCVFSSNNTFIERMLLPIVPQKANYLTFRVKAIPFFVKSSNNRDQVCYLRNTDDKTFIYEEKSQRFMEIASCESKSLCQIPKLSEFKTLSEVNCISAVFFNNTENIAKFCQFECQYLQDSNMFRRVSSNSIVLFSVIPNEIQFFYRCESDGLSIPISTTISDVASLKVTLPCNCKLYRNFDEIFRSISPCTNKSLSDEVVQILPLDILRLDLKYVNENPSSNPSISYDYRLLSDNSFRVSLIAFFIVMLISLFYKISQQERRIQILSNWHENELELRIQYFNENNRLIFNDNVTEIIKEKK